MMIMMVVVVVVTAAKVFVLWDAATLLSPGS